MKYALPPRRTWLRICLAWIFPLICFVTADALAADRWWNNDWHCLRTFEVTPLSYQRPGEEAVHVTFTTGGYLQPNGEDLRVLAGGEIIPHKLVWVGPGDRVSLLFKYVEDKKTYEVYYGNPKCGKMTDTWTPQRGLILETRQYKGGNANSLADMKATLKRAGKIHGRGLVEKVWHGVNPFGPSLYFVTTYSGWLHVRKAGVHEMTTSSAAASFMLLDDKLAVQWPGWHGAVADARIKRPVNLSAGAHKFTYYHVQGNGNPIMVAAWRTPTMKKPEVISPAAFLPPMRGQQTDYHLRGETFAPDFTWRNVTECLFNDRYAITMQFTDTSFPHASGSRRRLWDFGDGIISQEAQPTHVFMATGAYTISLTVFRGENKHICRQKIVVDCDWARQQTLEPESLNALAEKIKNYPFEKMTAAPLLGVAQFHAEREHTSSMLTVGNLLLKKLDQLEENDLLQAAIMLGVTWREEGNQPETALNIFRRAEKLLKQPVNRARMAVLSGDTLFYHLEKPASAKAVYERVRKDYPQATQYVRMALLRLGDIARQAGQLEEAKHYYRKSRDLRPKQAAAREAMTAALRALETEDLFRRGEDEAVKESLHLWQWQDPEEKLRGQWSVMMIRIALKNDKLSEAVKEAEALILANPESQYVPEILLLLSEAQTKQKNTAKARATLEKLKQNYPDSPLVAEAEKRLGLLASPK